MLTTQIESILLASSKPVSRASLRKALNTNEAAFDEAVEDIKRRFNVDSSGVQLLEHESQLQFVTNPTAAEIVATFLKQDSFGELTRPSLETLTVIAYRGPITKPELEQIRGVNCSLILRNLAMRGLVEEREDVKRLQPVFSLTTEFVRSLGLKSIEELPEFAELHSNERITQMIQELAAQASV